MTHTRPGTGSSAVLAANGLSSSAMTSAPGSIRRICVMIKSWIATSAAVSKVWSAFSVTASEDSRWR